jgi:hypothetical protein
MSGKGSKPRPFSVDPETYASNYDRIFGNKKTNKTTEPSSHENSHTESESDQSQDQSNH